MNFSYKFLASSQTTEYNCRKQYMLDTPPTAARMVSAPSVYTMHTAPDHKHRKSKSGNDNLYGSLRVVFLGF